MLCANSVHPYTEALLSGVPMPEPAVKCHHIILQRAIPSSINRPSGCVFRTRCSIAVAACAPIVPPLVAARRGAFTCLHQAASAVAVEELARSHSGVCKGCAAPLRASPCANHGLALMRCALPTEQRSVRAAFAPLQTWDIQPRHIQPRQAHGCPSCYAGWMSSPMRCVALRPLPVSTTTVVSPARIVPAAMSFESAAAAAALVGSA